MHLWLSKNSEVPLREQLVTQVVLGIVSDDLKPGQKLPSTRELARRFQIHANTVSNAYRDLSERGWVEFRKGSGVYVRARTSEIQLDAVSELDHLISVFLQMARHKNFSLGEIQSRVKHWLAMQPPDHFLIIEPDAEFRQILIAEIKNATGARVAGADLDECKNPTTLTGAVLVAMYGQAESVRAALAPDTPCLLLHSRSVPESLHGAAPPPADALVAVASRWPEFLRWSRTILVAAGIDSGALNFRDARIVGWQKGLRASAFVITDALTATRLPAGCDARIFHTIADSSLTELQNYAAQFFVK